MLHRLFDLLVEGGLVTQVSPPRKYYVPPPLNSTSTLRLLGRFTTCIAQTTTALRLFFALNGTSCLRNEKKWKFSILKRFSNFVPSR